MLAVCGEAGVKELDKQMSKLKNEKGVNKRQGAFQLFYLDELQSKDVMPIFFTRDDSSPAGCRAARAFEDMPSQLSVIDLRVLGARLDRAQRVAAAADLRAAAVPGRSDGDGRRD